MITDESGFSAGFDVGPARNDDMMVKLKEAQRMSIIAWSVCASIHREFAKGRDPLFSFRQADFQRYERDARVAYHDGCCPKCGGDCTTYPCAVISCPVKAYGS